MFCRKKLTKNIYLKEVNIKDVNFILKLRTDKVLSKYLNYTENNKKKQLQWLKKYFKRREKKDEFYNGEIPFITIGDIRGNMHIIETQQTLSEIGANQNQNKFLPKGSICVTCIASPGLVGFVTKDSQTNQQINSIICKREENKFFLYFYLKDYFKFAKASSGSTFSNMNKGEFSSIKTIKPRKEILIDLGFSEFEINTLVTKGIIKI